jgi:hypothetical protein
MFDCNYIRFILEIAALYNDRNMLMYNVLKHSASFKNYDTYLLTSVKIQNKYECIMSYLELGFRNYIDWYMEQTMSSHRYNIICNFSKIRFERELGEYVS